MDPDMSTIYCKYHPKIAARWECPDCNLSICGGCASKDTVRNTAQCPVCKNQLTAIAASNFIEPFWHRIPRFFKYPANGQALIFIAVAGFFMSFGMYGGLMSMLMLVVFSLAFLRYAMMVLDSAAEGRDKPIPITIQMFTSGHLLPLKLLATYIAFGLAVSMLSKYLGPVIGLFGMIFVLATLPASTMALATTESFMQAINPMMLIGIVKGMGKSYWVLYLFLILLSACQGAVVSFVAKADSFLLWPVQNAIGMYFTLIMFNLMGYVMFQHHEQLGYSVRLEVDQDYGRKSNEAHKSRSSHPAVQEAELLLKEGNIEEATKRLTAAAQGSNVPLEVHKYYHQLLFNSSQAELMAKHAKDYLNILLYHKKTTEAARLVVDCFKHKISLRPADANNLYTLVYALKDIRAFKECVALANNFHVQNPNHPDTPRLYLLVAKILSEELRQDAMASKILQFLISKYPQHELAAEIDRYFNIVKSVANG